MSDSKSAANRPIRRGPYPELTLTGILVGYLLGALIAISIGYASLILGFSIEGSELAAILGFGILRGVLRRRSIIENNINQSVASAVNAASAGMMFSVPALFILGYTEFNRELMVLGCITGGVLGVAFIIPLRKQMIDFERLAYPGGIAVATILKSPGAGMRKAYLLLGGALLSALVKMGSIYAGHDEIPLGEWIGLPEFMNGYWEISVMTIGVGFLSGKGGVYFIVGGYVCYWFLAPILNVQGLLPSADELQTLGTTMPNYLQTLFRPLGIGMLIGGALTGVALALPLVISAVRSMQQASKTKSAVSRDEMPIRLLYIAVGLAFVVLLIIAWLSVDEMTLGRAMVMAILGTLWIWMAGVILSECIGRTNWSPLSGMTLIGITILIFVARGMNSPGPTVIAAVMVGAAMCVAMSQATDLMLDLKTGYLVGATPRKQQIAQFLGTWLGPILIMGLIFVLHNDSPLGGDKYEAPQGQALAQMISGILGGDVPTNKYMAGAGLGALLSASGIGGLGILVGLGFYLSFSVILTYTIGTISRLLMDAVKGVEFSEQTGIPIAAGFIVGEALVGVGNAIYSVVMAM